MANPRLPDAYFQLTSLLEAQGRWAEAAENYRKLLRESPNSAQALSQLAWLLATAGDDSVRNGAEAATIAASLLQRGESPELLRILAAAQAAQGNFAQAVATASRALGLAVKDAALAASLQNELTLYRAGKPFLQGQP